MARYFVKVLEQKKALIYYLESYGILPKIKYKTAEFTLKPFLTNAVRKKDENHVMLKE